MVTFLNFFIRLLRAQMTNSAYQQLIDALKKGDNKPLDQIFKNNYHYCVKWLTGKYQCSKADAEDIFMDALLIFRTEAIKGKVNAQNIKGYLVTVAKNIYLQQVRKNKTTQEVSIEKVEYTLGAEMGIYDEDFDPVIKKEIALEIETTDKQEYLAYQKAWKKLGEQCKNVLKGFYIDKKKLKDLQHELGYSTYDTIKSIRRRCFNQLKDSARQSLL